MSKERYFVYDIELDKDVMYESKFKKANSDFIWKIESHAQRRCEAHGSRPGDQFAEVGICSLAELNNMKV